MSLYLLKAVDDLTCNGVEYWREVGNGWVRISYAIDLWNIINSPKGKILSQLLDDVKMPNKDGLRIIPLSIIQQIKDMLENFEEDIRPLVDENWHILPQYIAFMLEKIPECVDTWQAQDQTIYSLINAKYRIMELYIFFEGALCLQSEVQLGERSLTSEQLHNMETPPKFRFNPDLPNIQAAVEDARNVPPEQRENSRIYQRALVELRKELALNLAVRDETIRHFPRSEGYGLLPDIVLEKEYASQQACLRDNPIDHVNPYSIRVAADGTTFVRLGEISILVRNLQTNQVMLIGAVKSDWADQPEDAVKQLDLAQQIFATRDTQGYPVQNGHRVRAFIISKDGRETRYQDVTNQIDASSVAQAQRVTYGSDDQAFDRGLGYTTKELDELINEATQ